MPRGGGGPSSTPVSITNGYFARLPQRGHVFFRRFFVQSFPRPIVKDPQQLGLGADFTPGTPRTFRLARFEIPKNQVIVFRDVIFTASQKGGIDLSDLRPVAPHRLATYVSYEFMIGGQSGVDLGSNITGAGGLLNQDAAAAGNLATATVGSASGAGSVYAFGGSIARGLDQDNFALYGWSGQLVDVRFHVLRPPPLEVVRISVELSGWFIGAEKLRQLLGD